MKTHNQSKLALRSVKFVMSLMIFKESFTPIEVFSFFFFFSFHIVWVCQLLVEFIYFRKMILVKKVFSIPVI